MATTRVSKKRKFVADGVMFAEVCLATWVEAQPCRA
jgi:hypothetical protein